MICESPHIKKKKKKSYVQIWLSKCNVRMQLETYLFFYVALFFFFYHLS